MKMTQKELTECLKQMSYNATHILDKMAADENNKALQKIPIFKNGQLKNIRVCSTIDYPRLNRLVNYEEKIVKSPSFLMASDILSQRLKIMSDLGPIDDLNHLAKHELCNFITQYVSERYEERSGAFNRSVTRFYKHIKLELPYFSYITPLYNVGGNFSEIIFSKTTRIRRITDKEYVCIIDTDKAIKDIESYQKRLRFVIEHRASVGSTLPLDDAKEEYALITNLIRLTGKCMPEFGQIYLLNSTYMDVLGLKNAEAYESTPQRRGFVDLESLDTHALVAMYCDLTGKFNKGKKFKFLANSIARFGMARRHRRDSNKLVDNVISLEALLTEGPGESTLKLSHRTAALCGDSDKKRLQIWEFIKEVYKFRSGVVHKSSEEPFVINSKVINMNDASYNLDMIVRTAILRMLKIADTVKSKEDILNQLDRSIYDKNLMRKLENFWK